MDTNAYILKIKIEINKLYNILTVQQKSSEMEYILSTDNTKKTLSNYKSAYTLKAFTNYCKDFQIMKAVRKMRKINVNCNNSKLIR